MRYLTITFLLLFTIFSYAQEVPFNKGVNLTNWFQADSPNQIQFSKYTKTDFENIKSLGCDVVRLPINLHFMTNGAPNYELDPLFLSFLDKVVEWAKELEVHLILDNHTFDSSTDTDPNVGDILLKVWPQMAEHYKNKYAKLYFEVLNEPHGISDALWNSIQQEVVASIREIDQQHTIIIGPAGWNSYNNLEAMPEYDDENLIYTFHFYDPFLFTHQGAGWSSLEELSGVPFPYSENNMPEVPEVYQGTWIEASLNDYDTLGSIGEVKRLIDIAVEFGQERNVPLFCGEFGVYDVNSPEEDRSFWYKIVREYLEENNIAWTTWDYHGGFGLFEKEGFGMFHHDLNIELVENLGLTPPEQTPFEIQPETKGFEIYGDFAGSDINLFSHTEGELDFYSNYRPNYGNYCIEWSGAEQYNSIVFDFQPDKDLSQLASEGYALDLLIRSDDPATSIDVRFIDSDEGENDHPWRNRIVVEENLVTWDTTWNHLHIPLTDFEEQGAWEDAWYNPEGLFDWSKIDRLEIVAESKAMSGETVWIDNIFITNQDTVQVKDFTGTNSFLNAQAQLITIGIEKEGRITFQPKQKGAVDVRLFSMDGRCVFSKKIKPLQSITTTQLQPGIYVVSARNRHQQLQKEKVLVH